jgi:hypothetical protein
LVRKRDQALQRLARAAAGAASSEDRTGASADAGAEAPPHKHPVLMDLHGDMGRDAARHRAATAPGFTYPRAQTGTACLLAWELENPVGALGRGGASAWEGMRPGSAAGAADAAADPESPAAAEQRKAEKLGKGGPQDQFAI